MKRSVVSFLSQPRTASLLGRRRTFTSVYCSGRSQQRIATNLPEQFARSSQITDRLIYVRNIMTMTSPSEVKHDADDHVFYMQIQKGDVAKLEYNWVDKGTIDFFHTEVPVAYRGMGCAKLLAKAALDFAVEKDVKIIVSCSYLAKYVSDNPSDAYTNRIIQK